MGKLPTVTVRSLILDAAKYAAMNPYLDVSKAALDAADKIAAVAQRLEPEQVVVHQGSDDVLPPREASKNIGGRKRDVKKEGEGSTEPAATQFTGHKEELIIVNPYEVSRGGFGGHDVFGEAAIDGLVRIPVCLLESTVTQQIVKEGPEALVRESLIVTMHFFFAQRNGMQVVGVLAGKLLKKRGVEFHPGVTGPADPYPAVTLHDRSQRRYQPAGARAQRLPFGRLFDHNGKAV
jgi:hypothetical protein